MVAIDQAKLEINMARGDSKVMKLNISEGQKTQDSNKEKSEKIDRNYKKVHHREKLLLAELHSKVYNSSRMNKSNDYFDTTALEAQQLSKSIDESGFVLQKKATKQDKQQTSFLKPLESYHLSTKELSKSYIKQTTVFNEEKFKLIAEYLQFAQRLDSLFSEMKQLSNDNMQDQIIATLLKSQDQTSDLNRRLLDLQTELLVTQSLIDQDKEVLISGTKYTMQKAVELEKSRENSYKEEKKNDKVMTL